MGVAKGAGRARAQAAGRVRINHGAMTRSLVRLVLLLLALGTAVVLILTANGCSDQKSPPSLKQRLIDRFGPIVVANACGPPVAGRGDPPPRRVEQFRLTRTEEGRYRFELRYRRKEGGIYRATGVITDGGSIAVSEDAPSSAQPACPICLAAKTRIATPRGPVRVSELRQGDRVWTRAMDGSRQPAVVMRTARRTFAHSFPLVRLVLEDGRRLTVSARHPTAEGRPVGGLTHGSRLDGSRIRALTVVFVPPGATYDLLPSGPSRTYWAEGVLLRSTLSPSRLAKHGDPTGA